MKPILPLIALGLALMTDLWAQTVVTSPPPAHLVLVPNPSAWSISKHPTRPALYLGCYAAEGAKNLITYRLNADGSLIPESRKDCDNYFTVNATNTAYHYRVQRPSVLVEQNILYVIAGANSPVTCFANINNNEIVALALDDEGQPAKVLKAFRTDQTGTQYLFGVRFDPTTQRLYLAYWTYLGWYELGKDGLPTSEKFNLVLYAANCWYWDYVPEWERFFTVYSGVGMRTFKLGSDGTPDLLQALAFGYGDSAWIQVSAKFKKLYNLDRSEDPRLVVGTLTKEGRITGLPRYFPLPGVVGIRCDFTASKLYGWTSGAVWKTWSLDADGLPRGEPQVSALGCGEIKDVFVDEPSGKVYIACTQPPPPAK